MQGDFIKGGKVAQFSYHPNLPAPIKSWEVLLIKKYLFTNLEAFSSFIICTIVNISVYKEDGTTTCLILLNYV